MRVRYPRTPHLPWSPGATPDDVRAADLSGLEGQEVVVTEKLDGENTTLYRDGLHARSLDSAHHPSRAWIKALHGRIAPRIPPGWRVSGENLFARHSIAYDALESWFYAFSIWNEEDRCLDWDATVRFARRLGVPVPPVLWRGTLDERNERALRSLRLDLSRQEGYVVRTARGFPRDEFPRRVAKWVRSGHVQTDEHWMLGPVVPNGRGPSAALWDVRSGAKPEAAALLRALRLPAGAGELPDAQAEDRGQAAAEDAAARLDVLADERRTGDARLSGVLAALLHERPRVALMTHLPAALGMPLARRVGDLVGLHGRLLLPFPDERRRAGLMSMVRAVDLGVLHAAAAAALAGRRGPDVEAAREQVAWSELHAAEADLLGEAPLAPLREGLREALDALDVDAQDRCWAEAVEAWAEGRLHSPEEAAAYGWRWRAGQFPRLVLTVGPSGSGKSSFVERALAGASIVSLDELRAARGSRADQGANAEVLREGLERLEALLAAGQSAVWDATALTAQQRSLPLAIARRRDALVTCAVFLVPDAVLAERNARRTHAVPEPVLAAQLERFAPPYPGDAHRTWYIDAAGRVADSAGTLLGEEP